MTKEQKQLYLQGEDRERKLAERFENTGKIIPFEEPIREGQWYRKIVPGAVCADGSEYPVLFNSGKENCLVIFLEGGGLSFDEEMARCPNSLGNANIRKPPCYAANFRRYIEYTCFDNEYGSRGIVEKEDERNPFREWCFAVATYGTADIYAGDGEFAYRDEEGRSCVLHHRGYSNFIKSLELIKELYPAPKRILLIGGSAGAFGVPLLAPEVLKAYPDCSEVTVYADSATCPDGRYKDAVYNVWKAPEHIAGALRTDQPAEDWFEALYKQEGDRLNYLYSISIRDWIFISYLEYLQTRNMTYQAEREDEFKGYLKQTVKRLKQITKEFRIMITDFPAGDDVCPGATIHTTCQDPRFYEKLSCGISPVQWLWDAVNKKGYDIGLELL